MTVRPLPHTPTSPNNPKPNPQLTPHPVPQQFYVGDTVRITNAPAFIYKVIAVTKTSDMVHVTILIVNPQPDGRELVFNNQSLRSMEQDEIERVPSGPAGAAGSGS